MILAAGLGTRLFPITKTKPKALIQVNDIPLIQIVIDRLIRAGVTDIVINFHHFPDQIRNFLEGQNFSVNIEFSVEKTLLETGGGLKKAGFFFEKGQTFFLHNVDILSNIDLTSLYNQHNKTDSLATLAVQQRKSSRYLIFDEDNILCGWKSITENKTIMVRTPHGRTGSFGFCGVHVISSRIFENITEKGAFSIIDTYLRLAGEGEKISSFVADGSEWQDFGKLEQLPGWVKKK